MGERINADVQLEVTSDSGNRVDFVTGATSDIDEHGFLHILDSKGSVVAVFAKFDSVIVKHQVKEG